MKEQIITRDLQLFLSGYLESVREELKERAQQDQFLEMASFRIDQLRNDEWAVSTLKEMNIEIPDVPSEILVLTFIQMEEMNAQGLYPDRIAMIRIPKDAEIDTDEVVFTETTISRRLN